MEADKLRDLSVTGGIREKGIRKENKHCSSGCEKSGNSCSALGMSVERQVQ